MDPNEKSFYERDAVLVAKELLGKVLVIKGPGSCNYKWRIIETEAYKGEENENNETICHDNENTRTCGKIFAEGNNGLIITCGSESVCDNVLVRGLLTIFYSQPYKAMQSAKFGCEIELAEPVDLTLPKDKTNIYIEKDKVSIADPPASVRVGMESKSDKAWNFKLFILDNKTETIDASFLKGLNEK